ncbi:hypothetical protein CYLTODRAFT_422211 [Cylindrobasidium torrendii FP15055 ss-10]|uniref:Uncharacterized protein n=1 Tax=Cylindrobasidium torrendii FP15055 ss-10 TaxID=1314674 RepID=A0A0D7BDV8_9AGAR|nr:hypothetical protein CYLTODRAFT_422211 [Cylindrobasidium torrendii FP15055 ss-10]
MHPAQRFAAVQCCLAWMSSFKFNIRRLEGYAYSLGALFATAISDSKFGFFPRPCTEPFLVDSLIIDHPDILVSCPQLPIYIASVDPGNYDTTMPDGEAEGVYVDGSVVLISVSPSGGQSTTGKLDDAYRLCDPLIWRDLLVDDIVIPLLQEQKRNATRNPDNLGTYYDSTTKGLSEGMYQVQQQAVLLFSCLLYYQQDLVVLYAGAGDLYLVAALDRASADMLAERSEFDFDVYNTTNIYNAQDLAESTRGMPPLKKPSEIQAMRQKQEKAQEEAKRAAQNIARSARAANRPAKARAATDRASLILEAGKCQLHPMLPYSDQDLALYHKLSYSSSGGIFPSDFWAEKDFPVSVEDMASRSARRISSGVGNVAWSGIIRYGSDAHNHYFNIISKYIGSLALAEKARRKQEPGK